MGQASGGDREDSGGLVRRSHVLTAKHSKRASLAARKKTGGGRAGRTAVRLPCDGDRKSTRLNSSHTVISYAVFCLKKKKKKHIKPAEKLLSYAALQPSNRYQQTF